MLDQLNEDLIEKGEDCVVFDYDCREGICGTCSLVINGHPHGEKKATTTCQLYMRDYADQSELWIEPWRAKSFPIVKDLAVKRERLTELFNRAVLSLLQWALLLRLILSWLTRMMLTVLLIQRFVLAAVHALRYVRMHQLHYLWLQK